VLPTILAAAETGACLKSCYAVAGIDYETLREWIQDAPEIGDGLAEARERAPLAAQRIFQLAWTQHWRAAAWFPRLGFREDYSARAEIARETERSISGEIIIDE